MAPLLRQIGIVALVSVITLIGNPSAVLPGTPAERAPIDFASMSVLDFLQAADPTIPAEWAGIWQWTEAVLDCQTLDPLGPGEIVIDTLCTGASVGGATDPTIEITCTGTVTATSFNVTCTGSFELFPGCTQHILIEMEGTRTGESATSWSEITTSYVGAGCFFEDVCLRYESVGERIGPEPASCTTPVEPSTWGAIKKRYE